MSEPAWISELIRAAQSPRLAFAGLLACELCFALGNMCKTENEGIARSS
jgi:hypothetical protein